MVVVVPVHRMKVSDRDQNVKVNKVVINTMFV